MARNIYGREFLIDMMAHAFARLENSRDILPNVDIAINAIRTFFALFDDAKKVHDQPRSNQRVIPLHIVISMSLLVSSEGTPYFKNGCPLDGVEFYLAVALAALNDKANPQLAAVLKITAESA